MKKITFLACLVSIITSCSTDQDKNAVSTDFTMNSTHEGFKKDNFGNIVYDFKGSIKNNTQNIYKQVTINMRVVMNLDNGQQLTDESINADDRMAFFSGLESLHISEMLAPGKEDDLHEFESASIDPKYTAYPIKSVFLQFTAETKDEVNGTSSDKILIKNDDITAKWKEIMSKTDQDKQQQPQATN